MLCCDLCQLRSSEKYQDEFVDISLDESREIDEVYDGETESHCQVGL
jgi:hypothetical protein